jgi:integrase
MIHVEGSVGGEFVRSSTRTRSKSRAEAHVKRCERLGRWEPPQARNDESADATIKADIPSIQDAVSTYLSGLKRRSGKNLLKPTVSKHRTVVQRLADFAIAENLTLVSEIDFDVLDRFRETWETEFGLGPQSAANYIVRLTKMGRFFVKKKWWPENYASDLDYPEDYETTERLPLSEQQIDAVLEAARTMKLDVQSETTNWEIETFILLMWKGGMAIGDASLLEDAEVVGDELRYYRKKRQRRSKKVLVVFPLPEMVLERLRQIKRNGLHQGRFYFCRGSVDNASDVWHKRLAMVFKAAAVDGEPHQFRHTFAQFWLSTKIELPPGSGNWGYMPVKIVAKYLGHENEATTRKYYSHWIKEQEQEASDIARSIHRLAQSAA